jgi:hypothetical protein
VTQSVRAWTLTGAGAFDSAYRLLVTTADNLAGNSPQRWSVWGWLNLQAALSTARRGDADRTWEHFAAAQHAAHHIGSERDGFRLSFGPANVAVWASA